MRIVIATTTRADWGLLSTLARSLDATQQAEVLIMAGNMHYMPECGLTYREIERDGFEIAAKLPAGGADTAATMAGTLRAAAEEIERLKPDILVALGDRYEMLAIVSAAALRRVPVVHIAGGAISEGAFDDCFRHAITKLSALHLTETEVYRRRVIQMGENPCRVVCTGAIGVYNAMNVPVIPLTELRESLGGFEPDKNTVLATLHPATLETVSPVRQIQNMLDAFKDFPENKFLLTYPNNDTDPRPLIQEIEAFAAANPGRVCAVPSLGHRRYLSALHYVGAVAGNSSSGIVEVPSMKIPTLDIGIRQQGRTAADSVLHCNADTRSITEGLRTVLSYRFREIAANVENPYYKADTPQLMVKAIMDFAPEAHTLKRFYDLK